MHHLVTEFREALSDEVAAAAEGPSSHPILLRDGRRLLQLGEYFHYQFEIDRELPRALIEGSDCEVRIGATAAQGIIVSEEGFRLTVALLLDHGKEIPEAQLIWDLTFLLRKLSERLCDRIGQDNALADLLVGRGSVEGRPVSVEDESLNAAQREAVGAALGTTCTWIWGPPGTGKTRAIGALVAHLVRDGRSVLIASHTNVAVDEALLRAADALGTALPDGRVIRLGEPRDQRLVKRPRLLANTHAQEREAPIRQRLEECRSVRAALVKRSTADQRSIALSDWLEALPEGFSGLDRLDRALERGLVGQTAASQAAGQLQEARRRLAEVDDRTAKLQKLLGQARSRRNTVITEQVQVELAELRGDRERFQSTVSRHAGADAQLARARDQARHARRARQKHVEPLIRTAREHAVVPNPQPRDVGTWLRQAGDLAQTMLGGLDVGEARQRATDANHSIAQLDAEMASCKDRLKRVGDELVDSALVVATTLTGTYLRRAVAARTFDTVIIDETSIAPLPAAWFAATLAERAVVPVGDFRQLAPIVLAQTPLAQHWLGRDAFEASGVRDAWERGEPPAELKPLVVQHRMAPAISALPNRLYYRGLLHDGEGVDDDGELAGWFDDESPFTEPSSLLDHGVLRTWASSVPRGQRSSRCNVLAAAVTVDAVSSMLRPDRSALPEGARPRLLIITPYRPQAELLQAMLRARHLHRDAVAGTAHAFQGSEASVVLLDLAVAAPHYRAGIFSSHHAEDHRRLLNVAITRARRRLVVVGDIPFIRKHAGESALGQLLWPLRNSAGRPDVRSITRLTDESSLGETVAEGERYVVWYTNDPERHEILTESIAAAATRGIPAVVITDPARMTRVGLRGTALTRLRDAGTALISKDPLREAMLIVDGATLALRPSGAAGWSVWENEAVAGLAALAHHVPGLVSLVDENRASCPRCYACLVLREGDHSSPGLYARCSKCGAPAGPVGRRTSRQGRTLNAADGPLPPRG